MRIRAPKDLWSGVMFCGFAVVAISAAHRYSLGSAGKMGPGYFPLLLAVLLALLGATLIARSVVFLRRAGSAFSHLAADGDCGRGMPVWRTDRTAGPRGFACGVDRDVGLGRRAVTVGGNARLGGRADHLFRGGFRLRAGPSAQYLAKPVTCDGRDLKSRPGICRCTDNPEQRLLLHRRPARYCDRRAPWHWSGHHGGHAAADFVHAAA